MKVGFEIKFQLFRQSLRWGCPAARFMGKGEDWEYLTNCRSDGKLLRQIRRGGGMVDTGDLKSPGSNTVPVRVRSPAPKIPRPIRALGFLHVRVGRELEVRG